MSGSVPFRARRSMAGAALGGRLYLFGGVGARTGTESILDVSDELWEYDPASCAWRAIPRAEPWPEARRCAGWAAHEGELLLWGGSGVAAGAYTFFDDLWSFAPGRGWRARQPRGPSARYWPAFESVGSELVLFGGYTEDGAGKRKLNDTWLLRGDAWQPVRARGPAARYGTTSASDADALVLFGGASDQRDHGDAWRFRPGEETWELLADGPGPEPRYCAACALHDGGLIVFGGRSRLRPKENYNDLWRLDLGACRWEQLAPSREPHRYDGTTSFPAYHAKSAVAVLDGALYLWGGEGRTGHVSDFWRLQLDSLAWELLQPARPDDPELW